MHVTSDASLHWSCGFQPKLEKKQKKRAKPSSREKRERKKREEGGAVQ